MEEETLLLLTCSSCGNARPKSEYSKTQWKKGHTSDGGSSKTNNTTDGSSSSTLGKAKCKRCIYMDTNDVVDFHVGDINTAPDTPIDHHNDERDVIDMSDLVDNNSVGESKGNGDSNNNGGGGGNNTNDDDDSGVPELPLISPPVSPPTIRNSTEVTSDDDEDSSDKRGGGAGGMNNVTMSNDTDDAVVDDMLNEALAVAGVTVLPQKSSFSQDDTNDVVVYEDQIASLEEDDNDDRNGGETTAAAAVVNDGGGMVEQMGVAKKEGEKEEEEEEEDGDEIQEIDPPTAGSDGEIINPPIPLQDSESIEDEKPSVSVPKTAILFQPHTGKTHQLRVAAKSVGLPILGDVRYGGGRVCVADTTVDETTPTITSPFDNELFDRTYLHAAAIHFELDNEEVCIYSPPPFGHLFDSPSELDRVFVGMMEKYCDCLPLLHHIRNLTI